MSKIPFKQRFEFEFINFWKVKGSFELIRLGFTFDDLEYKNQIVQKKVVFLITLFNFTLGIGYRTK